MRDGRIAAIVAEDDVPSGRSIDLEGRLVTPGLIDCHTISSSAAAGPGVGAAAERRVVSNHQRQRRRH